MEDLEKRIEKLEKENGELKEILKDVARMTYFAYNDIKFNQASQVENRVQAFLNKD